MASGVIQIDNYDVNLRRPLGKGAFGIVYTGKNRTTSNMIAVKNITYKEPGEEVNENLKNMGTNELEIFRKLKDHANIVQLFHHHDDGEAIWIFMEYCDLRDLQVYLQNTVPALRQKLKIMYECISAISYMHSFTPAIIHRDIKPQNILMTSLNAKNGHVAKVTDFGIGKLLETSSGSLQATMTTLAGTASYMAPEFFTEGYLRYKPTIDVFSLGLLFHILLQYDKSNNSIMPMSTEVVKTKKMCNFGQELSYTVLNNLPLPTLFDPPPAESDSPVHEVQRIITDMIKYQESERLKPLLVKDKIMEVYMHSTVLELEQKYKTRPISVNLDDKRKSIPDLQEKEKRQLEVFSSKEKSYVKMIKEKDTIIKDLRQELSEAQNVMLPDTQKEQETSQTAVAKEQLEWGGTLSQVLDIKRNDVNLLTKISTGKYGEIWHADAKLSTAVNIITDEAFKQNILQTTRCMQILKHEKIVQLIGVCTCPKTTYFITETMCNGNLLDFVKNDGGNKIKLKNITNIASQIAEGMEFLEEKCCVHRDLRAANILVGENDSIKIGNFFSAVFTKRNSDVYHEEDKDYKHALKWTAPEALTEGLFSAKSDIWSYGILLYELFTYGVKPYSGMTSDELVKRLRDGYRMPRPCKGNDECPESIYNDVMLKCWEFKPENRLTFSFCNYFFKDFVEIESPYMGMR